MPGWLDNFESIAVGLLTLEVNTIRKCGMSAQKMPDVPIALHSIVQGYQDYLTALNYGATAALLKLANQRVYHNAPDAAANQKNLSEWKAGDTPLDLTTLTNGADMFDALCWAAAAAIRDDNINRMAPGKTATLGEEIRPVIMRIFANSRQLSVILKNLQDKSKTWETDGCKVIGVTLEGTATAMFGETVTLNTPLDVTTLVRKAWDLGTETVLTQTSIQIDGDLVTRISPLTNNTDGTFILKVHTEAVTTALAQWQNLFALVKSLCGNLGATLFNSHRP